jgi:hypothetical protein
MRWRSSVGCTTCKRCRQTTPTPGPPSGIEHTFNHYDWHSVVEGLEEELHLVLVVPHHRVECLEERQGRSVATANSLKLARHKRLSYEDSRCARKGWCLNWHDEITMAYRAP